MGCRPQMVLCVSARYAANPSASCFSINDIPRRSRRSISWKIEEAEPEPPPLSRYW
jgi:hypothetical protein